MGVSSPIDFDRLFKLRAVVARHGEMDCAQWWNTGGLLGSKGAVLLGRGFPHTHRFAQARVVFAVARARCDEVFNPPACATLWSLPPTIEDQFDARWSGWLERRGSWSGFFDELQQPGDDLVSTLRRFQLVDESVAAETQKLKRSAEGKAVPLPGTPILDDTTLALLAAGFSRGERARLAVPYVRMEG